MSGKNVEENIETHGIKVEIKNLTAIILSGKKCWRENLLPSIETHGKNKLKIRNVEENISYQAYKHTVRNVW